MLQLSVGKDASEGKGSVRFERHCPEQTLLYQLVENYYPDFEMQWAAEVGCYRITFVRNSMST